MKTKTRTATIPKTLRGKKRYWLVRISFDTVLSAPIVTQSLLSFFKELYGSIGLARQKLKIVEFNPKTGFLIVQCALEHAGDVGAAIVLWNRQGNEAIKPELVLKTGSLKKARHRLLITAKT